MAQRAPQEGSQEKVRGATRTRQQFLGRPRFARHRRGVAAAVVAAVVVAVAAVAVVGGLYGAGILKFGSKGASAASGLWLASYTVNYVDFTGPNGGLPETVSYSSYSSFNLTISGSGGISGVFEGTDQIAEYITEENGPGFTCSGWFDVTGLVTVSGSVSSNGTASVDLAPTGFSVGNTSGTVINSELSGCEPASEVSSTGVLVTHPPFFTENDLPVQLVDGVVGSTYSLNPCIDVVKGGSCSGGSTFTIDGNPSSMSTSATDASGSVSPPVTVSDPPDPQLNFTDGSSILLASGSEVDWEGIGAYYLEKGAAYFKLLEEDLATKLLDADESCDCIAVLAVRGAEFSAGLQSDGNLTVTCYEGVVQVIELRSGGSVLLSGTLGVQAQQITVLPNGNENLTDMQAGILNTSSTPPPILLPVLTLHDSVEAGFALEAFEVAARYR